MYVTLRNMGRLHSGRARYLRSNSFSMRGLGTAPRASSNNNLITDTPSTSYGATVVPDRIYAADRTLPFDPSRPPLPPVLDSTGAGTAADTWCPPGLVYDNGGCYDPADLWLPSGESFFQRYKTPLMIGGAVLTVGIVAKLVL